MILKEICIFGYGNKTFQSRWILMSKSCAELIDENKEYTIQLGFKVTEKENTLPIMYWIFEMDENPIGARQVSSLYLQFVLQSKFLNLFPIF